MRADALPGPMWLVDRCCYHQTFQVILSLAQMVSLHACPDQGSAEYSRGILCKALKFYFLTAQNEGGFSSWSPLWTNRAWLLYLSIQRPTAERFTHAIVWGAAACGCLPSSVMLASHAGVSEKPQHQRKQEQVTLEVRCCQLKWLEASRVGTWG